MTIVAVDDTDSRTEGACTTHVAHRIAARLDDAGRVRRVLLVRLNPAVEHKTRGNAALAVHAEVDPERALAVARRVLPGAVADDPATSPGVVVAPDDPGSVPESVAAFARRAVRDHHDLADARELIRAVGYRSIPPSGDSTSATDPAAETGAGRGADRDADPPDGRGRGRIGALAAVGAWRALGGRDGDWTYELIAYRRPDRVGSPRRVDRESVFAAADRHYPAVWDTVDRAEGEAVCVPHTPGPVLYGIRGDDPDAVRAVADRIDGERPVGTRLFVTNQGTDAHLRSATVPESRDGRSYRLPATVLDRPDTRAGGHVFLTLADPDAIAADDGASREETPRPSSLPDPDDLAADRRLPAVAFEPTKRFRDRVRSLRPGDRLTACGERSGGTLKLEKFALRALRTTELATPTCPDCGRSMESAGAGQGYRCRDCSTTAPGRVPRPVDRDLEPGWYEVPPCARRHVAKPLVRGGFDAPTHPER